MIGFKPALSAPAKSPLGGMEVMFKSMGLGQVIEFAQQLASSGAVDKILKFSNDVEPLSARIEKIEADVAAIKAAVCRDAQPASVLHDCGFSVSTTSPLAFDRPSAE